MGSCYSPWFFRKVLYKIPRLFKVGPCGNYHWTWDRMCYCMTHEYCGDDGGVYDFKYKHWIRGEIIPAKIKES